jgi:hypothetical protein
MPDRHIRALRDELDRLIKSSSKLHTEINHALRESARHEADNPSDPAPLKPLRKKTARKAPHK